MKQETYNGLRVGLIGFGKLLKILSARLVAEGFLAESGLYVSRRSQDKLGEVTQMFPGANALSSNSEVIRRAPVVLFGVRPQESASALDEMAGQFSADQLLVSPVAGLPLCRLLKTGAGSIVRVTLNVFAAFGMSPVYWTASQLTDEVREVLQGLFGSWGKAREVSEHLHSRLIVPVGCGPALHIRFAIAFRKALISHEVPEDLATEIVRDMAEVVARILRETDPDKWGEIISTVKTKKGLTAEMFRVLDERGFDQALAESIAAATHLALEMESEALDHKSARA